MLYRLVRTVVGPLIRLGWRLEVVGAAYLEPGPAVVVANHDSLSDPVFLGVALERELRFLAKEELWSNRALAPLLDALGGIPVARGRGDREAVSAASRALESGAAVVVFPQGTVIGSADRTWHRGAARLALATGVPIVPVRLVGTGAALRPGTRLPRFARVRVVVGAPITVPRGRPTIAAARDLTARVREAVRSLA